MCSEVEVLLLFTTTILPCLQVSTTIAGAGQTVATR